MLACGLVGGDHFTVEAGTDGENFTIKFVVENWRRLWYQLTYPESMSKPKVSDIKVGLDDAFLELLEKDEHIIIGEIGPAGSWHEGSELGSNTGKRLVVGTHNKAFFHSMFKDSAKPSELHFMFCHHQVDGGATASSPYKKTGVYIFNKLDKVNWPNVGVVNGKEIDVKKEFGGFLAFPNSLWNGEPSVCNASWKSKAPLGIYSFSSGKIPETNIFVDYASYRDVSGKIFIRFPDDANRILNAGHEIEVKFSIYLAKGWYNGESDGTRGNLLLIAGYRLNSSGDVDYKGINGTMLHELGHSIQMVASEKMSIPGIKNLRNEHGRWYDSSRGHQGDHCAHGIPDGIYKESSMMMTNEKGNCVMFGAGWSGRLVAFCERCQKLVLAVEMPKF